MIKKLIEWARHLLRTLRERQHALLALPLTHPQTEPPTVYFLTPDYDIPSGGILVIYRHVDLLNAAGIRAFVLHQKRGFRCSWFTHQTQVADVQSAIVGQDDLLVVPEVEVSLLCDQPRGVNKAIFNQNSHLTWKWEAERVIRHYLNSHELADFLGAIVVSDHNAEMLRYAFTNLKIRRIHLGIDPALFHPGNGERRAPRIAYMPRRGGEDAEKVLHLLRGRGVLADWEVVALEGLSHDEVARQLRSTRIFMAFTYQEGFGLPAAEAMACGNYVIGYHGFGGLEFFRPEFSTAIDTGDILSFARAVEAAIEHERTNPAWCITRGLAASAFVLKQYSLEREREEVVSAYGELLGSAARYPEAEAVEA